jgi:peptide/nickel transport system permease protein
VLAFLIRRLSWGVVVLLGVSLITFSVAFLIPSDPARLIGGPHATRAALEQIRLAYHMDQPAPVQYVHYLSNLLQGNLGFAFSLSENVAPAIFDRLPATAMLALCAIFFELAIGLPIGIMASVWPQRAPDRLGIVFALIGFSIPPFVLGNILLIFFAFDWSIFPLGGAGGPVSIVLPAFTLGIGGAAWYSRLLRATMLEVLSAQYIKTAFAKGVSRRRVILRHALRNAAGPLITQFGLDLAYFLGGVVVVESVFAWPGVGQLAYNAIIDDDIPLAMGTVLISAVFVVLANVVVDLVQAWLDPRIRLS